MSENSLPMMGLGITEMEGKYLTFWLEEQLYGMPIADIVQIISISPITEVPEYPAYAKGIIQLRGGVVPVIDVRIRINKPEHPYDDKTCVIVSSVNNEMIGFIVDGVDAVSSIEDDQISAPPNISDSADVNNYLIGIGQQESGTVLLLDCQKIVPYSFTLKKKSSN